MPYIFVYGTLKSTKNFNGVLTRNGAKLIRKAKSLPLYTMYDMGCFPCIRKTNPGYPVYGEIWEVSEETIDILDRVEGHAYNREQIKLEGWNKPVEAYFFSWHLNLPIIKSGEWS